MTKRPSFSAIESFGECVENNEFFMQYTNHDLPDYYDANFLLLKYNPTLLEFKMIETLHFDYQQEIGQSHLHIYWPEDTGLFMNVMHYLSKENYELGKQALLQLVPEDFIYKIQESSVQIQQVTADSFPEFLKLNYTEDLNQGMTYADHKKGVYQYQFQQPHVRFLLATLDGRPVGSLVLIASNDYLEVDNILTSKPYRKRGVATTMIDYVRNEVRHDHKTVILVADVEDTPINMYKKIGFQTISTQIQAQKSI